ncbi:MAG: cytochrome P450 [Anaerolineae bacterium]|nr:cytochrome P450 [Anaerolineae bacterium]
MHDTQIASMAELEQATLMGVQVAGVDLVAVVNNGSVTVFEGRCPHQGTLLAEGYVDHDRLVCRAHGWQFHCASGAKRDEAQIGLHRFSVMVEDGKIFVDQAEVLVWAAGQQKTAASDGKRPLLTPEQLPGPRGLPLIGNLHQVETKKFHRALEDWYRQYGDLFQLKLGPKRIVAIADPDMVQTILHERPDKFSRLNGIKQTIEEMGVEGLFSAEGEQWRRHRHLATRAFDPRHLREFFPVMTKVTRRLHRRWQRLAEQASPIDVQKELMRYTVDITTNLAFGYDMNTLEEEGDRIQQHLEQVFPMLAYRAFMPVRYWNYLKLPADRALADALVELRGSIDRFIDHARQQLRENPALTERPQNLLQALLAAQADEDIEFSDLEIYGNVFTFLLAGEDTTANTMAWMIYFMAEQPDVLRQMQAEADAVIGAGATATDYDQTRDLRYIEAVAHETMRMKPVTTFLAMQALTDVTVNRLLIPQGMPVFLLLRPKGMEDSEFAAAAEFKPERWLNYSRRDNPHHRKSFSPFGGGPRLCPGRSLALLEIKMAMSTICRHFDVVRTEPDRKIEERFVFTLIPEDLLIALRPRSG